MIRVKELNVVLILVAFVLLIHAEEYSAEFHDRPYDAYRKSEGRKMSSLIDRQASLAAIRNLINGLDTRMIKRTSLYGVPCLGAGMSHNCEFNDLKETLKHFEQISSGLLPGRRKRHLSARTKGSARE